MQLTILGLAALACFAVATDDQSTSATTTLVSTTTTTTTTTVTAPCESTSTCTTTVTALSSPDVVSPVSGSTSVETTSKVVATETVISTATVPVSAPPYQNSTLGGPIGGSSSASLGGGEGPQTITNPAECSYDTYSTMTNSIATMATQCKCGDVEVGLSTTTSGSTVYTYCAGNPEATIGTSVITAGPIGNGPTATPPTPPSSSASVVPYTGAAVKLAEGNLGALGGLLAALALL